MFQKNNLYLLPLALVAFVALLAMPVASETLPTERTRINEVRIYDDNADVISEFIVDGASDTALVGTLLAHALVRVRVSTEYAATVLEAKANARVYLTIIGYDNATIVDNALGAPSYASTMGTYYLVPYQYDINPNVPLYRGTYTVIVSYDILIENVWTAADAGTYYMLVVYRIPEDVATWLPIMSSFGVIAGMGFLGLNISKPRDPTPGLYMMFAGVMFTWSVGWLPTWVFVTGVALISLVSAALWKKIFGRGG